MADRKGALAMAYEGYKYSFKNQFRTMASLTVYRTGRQPESSLSI